jgi:hypothetical protein
MWKLFLCAIVFVAFGCSRAPTSDEIQQAQQEKILQEGTSSVGMPAIKNFREKKILKTILEMRDQEGLATFTYVMDIQGKLIFLGESIGYGIPYATQFTSPEKLTNTSRVEGNYLFERMPQADPNGLFPPSSAEGTWVLLKNPNGKDVAPVLVEPRIVASPFKLH